MAGLALGKSHEAAELLGLHSITQNTPPKPGAKQIIAMYNDLPWLRSIVGAIANRVAQTKWTLHVARNSRTKQLVSLPKLAGLWGDARVKYIEELEEKSIHLEELESHPLLDMLNKGNAVQPGMAIFRVNQVYSELVGEAFLQLIRNGNGMPIQMFPLNPTWIQKLPSLDDPFYTRRTNRSTDERIPEADIISFIQLNPVDPFGRGSGLGMALGDELEIYEFASKHIKQFFFNHARPDLIISAEGMTQDDTTTLETNWLNRLRGFLKNSKPFFINRKIDVHDLGSGNFQSMQMSDLRQSQRDTVAQVFNIPPEILGITTNSNRATSQSAERHLSKNVIEPRQMMIANTLQAMLVPQYDSRLILGFVSQIPEDKDFQREVMAGTPSAFLVDEHRALADRPELEDDAGKVFPAKFNEVASPTPGGLAPAEPDTENSDKSKAFPPAVVKQSDEERIDRVIAAVIAVDLYDPMKAPLLNTIQEFGQRAIDSVGLEIVFDINDPNVVRYIDEVGFNKVKNLTNVTTHKALRKTLGAGLEAGESVTSLAKRINATFLDATSRRAFTIARTEVVSASSFGTLEGFSDAKVPRKQWISTRGPNVRDTHKVAGGMDGQIVDNKDDFQSPSGDSGPGPGLMSTAAENVNCQCDILPIFDVNQTGWGANADSEEKRLGLIKAVVEARAKFEESLKNAVNKGFNKQEREALAVLKRLSFREI